MPPKQKCAPLSVIIPTFNSAHFVTQAVESVLAQTLPPSRIIVVDDGSTDATPERLASYAGHVKYIKQPNSGVSAARNRGLEEVETEFVAFLDADDVWHPRKLELQMDVFAQVPTLALLGTRTFDWPAASFPQIGDVEGRIRHIPWQDLVVRNYIATSSVVVRREALCRAGKFDTQMQGPEDRDLWLRVGELGLLANLELPLIGYREVPGSVSKRAKTCQVSMCRILEKLDARNAWKGRWLLRRKAYSHVYHTCALLYDATGDRWTALVESLTSLAYYPLPYRQAEVKTPLERGKRLVVILLRLAGLKRPAVCPATTLGEGVPDALERLPRRCPGSPIPECRAVR
jgi:glycosyltransferase involved in cell wall biosynthesis